MVAHTFGPSTWKAEASQGYTVRPCQKKAGEELGRKAGAVHPGSQSTAGFPVWWTQNPLSLGHPTPLSTSSWNPRTCFVNCADGLSLLLLPRCPAHSPCHASHLCQEQPCLTMGKALWAPTPVTFQLGKVTRKRQYPSRAHTACTVSSSAIFKSKCHSCHQAERFSSVLFHAHPLECEIHVGDLAANPSWRRGRALGRRSPMPGAGAGG